MSPQGNAVQTNYVDLSGGLPLEGLSLAMASEPQFDLQSAATIRLSRPSVLRSTGEVLFRDEEAPALGARSALNRPSFATVAATRPLDARPRTAAKPSANSRPSAPTRRPPAGSARASTSPSPLAPRIRRRGSHPIPAPAAPWREPTASAAPVAAPFGARVRPSVSQSRHFAPGVVGGLRKLVLEVVDWR